MNLLLVLTVEEQEKLFRVIRELRSEGIASIYISHRLEEVVRIGDRVTVFRDGARISTKIISEGCSFLIPYVSCHWSFGLFLREEL